MEQSHHAHVHDATFAWGFAAGLAGAIACAAAAAAVVHLMRRLRHALLPRAAPRPPLKGIRCKAGDACITTPDSPQLQSPRIPTSTEHATSHPAPLAPHTPERSGDDEAALRHSSSGAAAACGSPPQSPPVLGRGTVMCQESTLPLEDAQLVVCRRSAQSMSHPPYDKHALSVGCCTEIADLYVAWARANTPPLPRPLRAMMVELRSVHCAPSPRRRHPPPLAAPGDDDIVDALLGATTAAALGLQPALQDTLRFTVVKGDGEACVATAFDFYAALHGVCAAKAAHRSGMRALMAEQAAQRSSRGDVLANAPAPRATFVRNCISSRSGALSPRRASRAKGAPSRAHLAIIAKQDVACGGPHLAALRRVLLAAARNADTLRPAPPHAARSLADAVAAQFPGAVSVDCVAAAALRAAHPFATAALETSRCAFGQSKWSSVDDWVATGTLQLVLTASEWPCSGAYCAGSAEASAGTNNVDALASLHTTVFEVPKLAQLHYESQRVALLRRAHAPTRWQSMLFKLAAELGICADDATAAGAPAIPYPKYSLADLEADMHAQAAALLPPQLRPTAHKCICALFSHRRALTAAAQSVRKVATVSEQWRKRCLIALPRPCYDACSANARCAGSTLAVAGHAALVSTALLAQACAVAAALAAVALTGVIVAAAPLCALAAALLAPFIVLSLAARRAAATCKSISKHNTALMDALWDIDDPQHRQSLVDTLRGAAAAHLFMRPMRKRRQCSLLLRYAWPTRIPLPASPAALVYLAGRNTLGHETAMCLAYGILRGCAPLPRFAFWPSRIVLYAVGLARIPLPDLAAVSEWQEQTADLQRQLRNVVCGNT